MSENQTAKKMDMPLALLLLIAHVTLNYRRLLGLIRLPSSFGVVSILQYLASTAITVVPIVMAVLLFMHAMKDTEIRKAMSILCLVLGIAFLLNFALTIYINFLVIRITFYDFFPTLGSTVASLALGVGMLNLFFKLRRDKLSKLKSYGFLFYYLMLFAVGFVIGPAFMDMSVQLNISGLTSNILLIAAGFFLPATILEEGKKSRPVDMVSLIITVFVAFCVFVLGGTISYSSYADSHQMPGVTTVTCPSCHKTYTDNGNKESIQRSNMCKSCKLGFDATKDALGW